MIKAQEKPWNRRSRVNFIAGENLQQGTIKMPEGTGAGRKREGDTIKMLVEAG